MVVDHAGHSLVRDPGAAGNILKPRHPRIALCHGLILLYPVREHE
jgi:hypothetical protein